MTMSEFDTLRTDLAGLRGDMSALRTDFDTRFNALRTEMDTRFVRIEAKIDEKPSAATIYQAVLATFAGMFAVMAGTVVVLKAIGLII
jgi:hypothetical protein